MGKKGKKAAARAAEEANGAGDVAPAAADIPASQEKRLSGNWQAKRDNWVEDGKAVQKDDSTAQPSPESKKPPPAAASPPSPPPSSEGKGKATQKEQPAVEKHSWIPASAESCTPSSAKRSPSSSKGGAKWKAGKSAQSWITADGQKAAEQGKAGGETPSFDLQITDVDTPLKNILTSAQIEALSVAVPKVELHAHLSGSIRESTLEELLVAQGGDPATSRFCLDALHVEDSFKETWEQTVEAFATIRRLTAYDSSIIQRIVMEAVESYAAAGCVYYEMRTGLKALPDKRSFLELLVSAVKRAQGKHDITVRLLVSVDRGASLEDARETIDAAIEAFESQNKDHGIVVGVEMGGNPLAGDWSKLSKEFERARAAGLKVSLHFAENKGEEKEHHSILDFAPERVGHAVFMSSSIADRLASSKIPVEVCLTCHEAFYKVPLPDNVFKGLRAVGHPAVLCCDNAGLLRTSIAKEYMLAINTFGLTARQLDTLITSSVGTIFADGKTRGRVMEACTDRLSELFPTLHGRQARKSAPQSAASMGTGGMAGAVGAAAAALLLGAVVYARMRN